jgi:hypothetical protein
MFSEVDNFLFYDFYTSDNNVNDDIYVFSNYSQNQASLVIYNNKFANVQGRINHSASRIKVIDDGQDAYRSVNLSYGLQLDNEFDFVIFKDITSNLEFIRSINDIFESGLFFDLHAYQTHVFLDFQQINDDEWQSFRRLCDYLKGNGVPSIKDAMNELLMQPVHVPLKEIINRGYFDHLLAQKRLTNKDFIKPDVLSEVRIKMENLLNGIFTITGGIFGRELIIQKTSKYLEFILSIPVYDKKFVSIKNKEINNLLSDFQNQYKEKNETWIISFIYIFLSSLGELMDEKEPQFQVQTWFEEWQITKIINELSFSYQFNESQQNTIAQTIYTILGLSGWHKDFVIGQFEPWFKILLNKQDIQVFLNVNRYQGQLWFNKERFEMLTWWLFAIALIEIGSDPKVSTNSMLEKILELNQVRLLLLERLDKSEYKYPNLLEID